MEQFNKIDLSNICLKLIISLVTLFKNFLFKKILEEMKYFFIF